MIEEIDITIKLANRDTISPIGIVRDVDVLCGKVKYPADFLVLGSPQENFFPLYLVDPCWILLMLGRLQKGCCYYWFGGYVSWV